MTNEAKIVSAIGIAVALLIGGTVWLSARSSSSTASAADVKATTNLADAGQLTRPDAYRRGDSPATVTVVEFGDFQCPACGVLESQVEQLMQSYKGKGVSLEFRNFPLPQHKNAQLAATAAEAAGAQGKYWEMHDKLYLDQASWTADPPGSKNYAEAAAIMEKYAADLGLDAKKFKQALDGRSFNDKLSRDLADADKLGINATPTFFVNGVKAENLNAVESMVNQKLGEPGQK